MILRFSLLWPYIKKVIVAKLNTVEPRSNEVLDITNDILCPDQSYSKMYGIEPRYNEPRYNEFFDITEHNPEAQT